MQKVKEEKIKNINIWAKNYLQLQIDANWDWWLQSFQTFICNYKFSDVNNLFHHRPRFYGIGMERMWLGTHRVLTAEAWLTSSIVGFLLDVQCPYICKEKQEKKIFLNKVYKYWRGEIRSIQLVHSVHKFSLCETGSSRSGSDNGATKQSNNIDDSPKADTPREVTIPKKKHSRNDWTSADLIN